MNYNVRRMDDNTKDVIHGLRKIRFRLEPEYKPYINYTIWLIINMRNSFLVRGLQLIFYRKHFEPVMPFKLEPFTELDIQESRKI